jgi:hypothetical protein
MATMKRPRGLYAEEFPKILETDISDSIKVVLSSALAPDPKDRETFTGLRKLLCENEEGIYAMPLTEVKRE